MNSLISRLLATDTGTQGAIIAGVRMKSEIAIMPGKSGKCDLLIGDKVFKAEIDASLFYQLADALTTLHMNTLIVDDVVLLGTKYLVSVCPHHRIKNAFAFAFNATQAVSLQTASEAGVSSGVELSSTASDHPVSFNLDGLVSEIIVLAHDASEHKLTIVRTRRQGESGASVAINTIDDSLELPFHERLFGSVISRLRILAGIELTSFGEGTASITHRDDDSGGNATYTFRVNFIETEQGENVEIHVINVT